MAAIEFKRIDADPEMVQLFAETSLKYGGIKIPIEYNTSSETWALFIDGELKGGFVIASGNSMRVPLIVPVEVLESSDYLAKFKKSSWCEVNQVWLSDDVKKYSVSMRMWLHIRKCVLRSGYSIVMVPWQLKNKGIDRFYRTFTSHILYQGTPRGRAGHSVEVVVGIADMVDVKWSSLKHFPAYLKKVITNRVRPSHQVKTAS